LADESPVREITLSKLVYPVVESFSETLSGVPPTTVSSAPEETLYLSYISVPTTVGATAFLLAVANPFSRDSSLIGFVGIVTELFTLWI